MSERPKLSPVVTPRLRVWLRIVFGLTALLGVNSAYLAAVTFLEWLSRRSGDEVIYQNYFSLWMFLGHLVLGVSLVVPFLAFSVPHLIASRHRKNRRAVRMGYALFAASLGVLVTGVMLVRVGGFQLRWAPARAAVYWLHIVLPVAVVWLYCLHRLAGKRIRWRVGLGYAAFIAIVAGAAVGLHRLDPRRWNVAGPKEGEAYFKPSLARTATGNFIPADTLMMDDYCLKCHEDAYRGWFHSAHHFSSFNNPMYLASVRETREAMLKRDGNVQGARWCAGCHDPVPFFSGAFDDPKYDDVRDETAHAGITCTTCHAITHVNSTRGNADYTIEEPTHYPFAKSESRALQFVNEHLVKARPALHKATFLKPLHKTSEFCSTCHKVHIPGELTHYREFLRGQNHYDSFILSGVSGRGARSNYFGLRAVENCAGCHMPAQPSGDFGARLIGDSKELSIHNHLFPGANTALPFLRGDEEFVKAHQEFLRGSLRVDIFGLKEGGTIDGELTAPLRPEVPVLRPGRKYLLETVLRTLKLGHHFTQGTTDSNEVWLDVTVTSGGRVIGRSGAIDSRGAVDPWSWFGSNYVLDKNGNQIVRRNPQDIHTVLYNHQIPPGAGQVVHYLLEVPEGLDAPITVEAKLQYRKFSAEYMDFVTRAARPGDVPIRGHTPGEPYRNELPTTTLASDTMTFPVEGVEAEVPPQSYPIKIDHIYMRWNDYGIALLREAEGGGKSSGATAQLKQAAKIFQEIDERFGYIDTRVNRARVCLMEGRIDEAAEHLRRAAGISKAMFFTEPVYAPWAINWFSGLVHQQQGDLDGAIECFEGVLHDRNRQMAERGFDFGRDYVVLNELGLAYLEKAKQSPPESASQLLRLAAEQFERTLEVDFENAVAHYNLGLLFALLGEDEKAEAHRRLHRRYKQDDNARDRAQRLARLRDPAADHAAEPIPIYSLHRSGAPGLPADALPVGEAAR